MSSNDPDPHTENTSDLITRIRDDPSNNASLFGDLYRGEVDRATAWRSRLDQTTNWAVVIVAAILTWAFSSPDNPHYVLLIGMLAILAFSLIEAHRFREYDIWRSRVRVMQEHLFARILTADTSHNDEWQRRLSESLLTPTFTMSFQRAVGHRLRRTYLPLLIVLLVAWSARITVFHPNEQWQQSASVPGVTGETVVLAVMAVYGVLLVLALWSATGGETLELTE